MKSRLFQQKPTTKQPFTPTLLSMILIAQYLKISDSDVDSYTKSKNKKLLKLTRQSPFIATFSLNNFFILFNIWIV